MLIIDSAYYFFTNPLAVPRFLRELEEQTVDEGDNAEFICGIYPSNCQCFWKVNGKDVILGNKYNVKTSQDGSEHTLVIKDVTEKDAGEVSAVLRDVETNAALFVAG